MNRFLLGLAVGLFGLTVAATESFAEGPRGRPGLVTAPRHGVRLLLSKGWQPRNPRGYPTNPGPQPVIPVPGVSPQQLETEAGESVVQTRRYLRVKNDTQERLTVYVQYRTLTTKDRWAWFPVDPEQSEKAAVYVFEPGEEADLSHEDWRVNASRVRIWAVTEEGTAWLENKEEDLWLVPEIDEARHQYLAPTMETYTVTFAS
jgi:hypothetical protein